MLEAKLQDKSITLEQLIVVVSDLLANSPAYYGHGTDNPLDEAAWLVLHALGMPVDEPVGEPQRQLSPEEWKPVAPILDERIATRKPLAYLLGSAWFCGLEFFVNEDVLVPRSPIAELIMQGFTPWVQRSPDSILDLCTGSGCIAIACAVAFPDARLDATDISNDALAVAQRNVQRHDLGDRLQLMQADVFENVPVKAYDVIVSNPPYVSQAEIESLPAEYHREPVLGLEADDNGLAIVRRILSRASEYLTEEGVLIVEVGNSQGALEEAYPTVPFVWLEFEHGGNGVFLLTRKMLDEVADILR